MAIRSAEIAVGEAEEMLAGLARLAEQTRAAAQDLPAALGALEADLASAAEWPTNATLQQAMSNAQAADTQARAFVAAVEQIEAGAFPVRPQNEFRCQFCDYAGVCRKDYVGDE